jgi:hypothetical protein
MALVRELPEEVSDRKRRLLACAYCRRVWEALTDERSRRAVEMAERLADGLATEQEVEFAAAAAEVVWKAQAQELWIAGNSATGAAAIASGAACAARSSLHATGQEALLLGAVGATRETASTTAEFHQAERAEQLALLRCIFDNPFQPPTIAPAWRTWNNATIPRLAQEIYDSRAFDRLPILADALEEAGCTNAEILNHCRQPGPHARGCWVVDLILGKK